MLISPPSPLNISHGFSSELDGRNCTWVLRPPCYTSGLPHWAPRENPSSLSSWCRALLALPWLSAGGHDPNEVTLAHVTPGRFLSVHEVRGHWSDLHTRELAFASKRDSGCQGMPPAGKEWSDSEWQVDYLCSVHLKTPQIKASVNALFAGCIMNGIVYRLCIL